MKPYIFTLIAAIFFASCTKTEVLGPEYYDCQMSFSDSSIAHPNAVAYQTILDNNQKKGLVGVTVMIKDKYGVWLGTAGKADIQNNIDVQPCHQFFIASITKVFTASLVYSMVDEGILDLDDYVTDWIDDEILKGLANADEAQIIHLLGHLSGIPDYYTTAYDMARMNAFYNEFTHEDILEYAKPLDANNEVGEAYRYCNTNYLLLGMILEKAGGEKLSSLYSKYIFNPLQFESAYYGGDDPIPEGSVKGYVDLYGDGKWAESEFLFRDELNTADGGIAINAYETGLFFEKLMKGEVISSASLDQMTDWFTIPDGWWDPDYYDMQGGYGLERFDTPYGMAVGHTGSIMGFLSNVQYFPEHDATFMMSVNCASYDGSQRKNIYDACLEIMFAE